MLSNEYKRFVHYADYAYNFMRKSYPFYNPTMYDKDELFNVCWETGNWKKYLDRSAFFVSSIMKYDMMQYMERQKFGRQHKVKKFQVTRIGEDFDIFIEYPDDLELVDYVVFLFMKIRNPEMRLVAITKIFGEFSDEAIAKKFNNSREAIRLQNIKSINVLEKQLSLSKTFQ